MPYGRKTPNEEKKKEVLICPICGKEFIPPNRNKKKRSCGQTCGRAMSKKTRHRNGYAPYGWFA